MSWKNRPTYKNIWDDDIQYALFIDESGDSSLKHVVKQFVNGGPIEDQNRFFTVSGVALKRELLPELRDRIMSLKEKHWESGLYQYKTGDKAKKKRVCFHSTEIRRKTGPFSVNDIDYNSFIEDLTNTMESLPIKVFSSTIDKKKHYERYGSSASHPYNLCLNFVLERYVKYYLPENSTTYIILESRGKKEDREILEHIKSLIKDGTWYVKSVEFKKIKGVYFNPKWCKESNEQKSYFGLEVADLCCYPMHRGSTGDFTYMPYQSIKDKIYNYPKIHGYGKKFFP